MLSNMPWPQTVLALARTCYHRMTAAGATTSSKLRLPVPEQLSFSPHEVLPITRTIRLPFLPACTIVSSVLHRATSITSFAQRSSSCWRYHLVCHERGNGRQAQTQCGRKDAERKQRVEHEAKRFCISKLFTQLRSCQDSFIDTRDFSDLGRLGVETLPRTG